jgi:small neutral amino acid transporter SnatA (MarC family)
MGALDFMYEPGGGILEAMSLVVAALLTVGGVVWAYRAFSSVERAAGGFHRAETDESEIAMTPINSEVVL